MAPAVAGPTEGGDGQQRKDVWSLILEQKKTGGKARGAGDLPDSHVYFVGAVRGGKSTLVSRFLNPDKEEEPRVGQGLEYTFARRSSAAAIDKKDTAHLWELSGGPALSKQLADGKHAFLPLTAIPTAVVVIALDLSNPGGVLDTLTFWLNKTQERLDACYRLLERKGSKLPEQLRARAKQRFGSEHEDADGVQHAGVPIVIVGTKYDAFMNADPEVRKVMARTLRFIAHSRGASLVYTGGLGPPPPASSQPEEAVRMRSGSKAALNALRTALNNYAFRTAALKTVEVDHTRALCIPAGADRFRDIGRPKGGGSSTDLQAGLSEWRAIHTAVFPPPPSEVTEPQWALDRDKYAEPEVDSVLMQLQAGDRKAEAEGQEDSSRGGPAPR